MTRLQRRLTVHSMIIVRWPKRSRRLATSSSPSPPGQGPGEEVILRLSDRGWRSCERLRDRPGPTRPGPISRRTSLRAEWSSSDPPPGLLGLLLSSGSGGRSVRMVQGVRRQPVGCLVQGLGRGGLVWCSTADWDRLIRGQGSFDREWLRPGHGSHRCRGRPLCTRRPRTVKIRRCRVPTVVPPDQDR